MKKILIRYKLIKMLLNTILITLFFIIPFSSIIILPIFLWLNDISKQHMIIYLTRIRKYLNVHNKKERYFSSQIRNVRRLRK